MDWKAIKDRGLALADQAAKYGAKAADKTFEMLEKTTEHTYEGLKRTPICIKNGTELDAAKACPLVAIFVIGKDDPISKSVLVRLPLLFKDAWIYSADLRIVLAEEVPELVSVLDVPEVPAFLAYRKGELEKRFTGEEVTAFMKDFNLLRPKKPAEAAPEVPEGATDVLAEAAAESK